MKLTVNSLLETKKLAEDFAMSLSEGDMVLLNGDLGAGKTTFTQFVFASLGVKDVVNSPTFAILKTYEGKFTMHHFDTYRITTEEAIEAGFDEVISNKESVKFIEWSENIKPLLPKKYIEVNIKVIDENKREFEITRYE
ncbi:MAG: tRNA (adenosine(37)-N6)-threonylcarbamoyltransferase complex ATPase subunit type 1 TsaE [Clostridia bacterium]|nr:tRNA (adenosine(37)-N6)-threonylcarbamoyltransferase complex ATPase subunit type 1 TsaE [Clostridia bacterium]